MSTHTAPRRGVQAVRANGEISTLIRQVATGFNEFRERYDAQLNGVCASLDQLHRDFAAYQLGGGGGDRHALDGDEYRTHARAFFSRVHRRPVTDSEVDLEALGAYEAAFPEYVRRGPAMSNDVRAAMQVGSDPDGGFWVPPQISQRIVTRMFETSPMRQVARIETVSTDHVEFPTDTNDATTGGWVGETEPRGETDTPHVGMQSIYAREQFAQPIVTQKLLDDATFDVERWLVDKITRKLTRDENTAFVSGTGIKQPRGFLDYKGTAVTTDDASRAWGLLQYVPTGAAGGFPTLSGSTAADADALIDLQLALKPDYLPNAKWAMRRSTAGVIRKLKDAEGRYLWQDNLTEGGRPLLLGHPVVLMEDMPAVGSDSFSVAFGDFAQGYTILDHVVGIRILRDNLTTKGKVKFYTTKRVGGDVVDFDAIKLLKFAAS